MSSSAVKTETSRDIKRCCGMFTAVLCGIAGFVLFVIYGIMALVPTGPFEKRDLTTGIVLLVLGMTFVSTFGGAIAGAIVGYYIIGPPVGCCLTSCVTCCDVGNVGSGTNNV